MLPLLKPQLDQYKKAGIVYRFTCPCGAVYIGETARELDIRIREHNQKSRNSEIYLHTTNCETYQNSLPTTTTKIKSTFHFHFRTFFTIIRGNLFNYFERICTESIYIILENPSINRQKDFHALKIF